MRFMLIGYGGGGADASPEVGYVYGANPTGGTVGLIAYGVTTACHPTFLTTSDGTLLLATGYDPVLRLRQNEKRMTPAGVPAPKQMLRILTAAEILADATSQIPQQQYRTLTYDFGQYGTHAGTYTTGYRADGSLTTRGMFKYSPQGEVSAVKRHEAYLQLMAEVGDDEEVANIRGNLELYFLKTQPRGFIGQPGSPYDWSNLIITVQIQNKTSASNPNVFVNFNGRYQAFMRYVDKDGLVSNPSPISTDTVLVNSPYVYYKNVEVPTDPRVVRRQVFRNVNGSSDAFYIDIDTTDIISENLVSYNTDTQLVLNYGQPAFDAEGKNLFYLYGEPPSDKPFIAEFNGAIFAVGRRVYRAGVVSAVEGSDQVTGIGTKWTKAFIGRKLTIENRQYTVIDIANQVITINETYSGPTNPFAKYSIEPFYANGNLLSWAEPGHPESWPIENSLSLPEDGDDPTGLVSFASSLWILKQRSVYSFSFTVNPGVDGDYRQASARGCINQNCAVQVNGLCLMMDRIGVHVFKGTLPRYQYQSMTTPDHLSIPIGDLFRFEGSGLRINFDADTCKWSGVHCLETLTVRWYVAMNGDDDPHHALCYDYLMDKWWVEQYPFPITASCIGNQLRGRPLLGGPRGQILQPDLGPLDIVQPQGTRLAVSEVYSPVKLKLDATPPDCVGTTLAIVSGTGHSQWSLVIAQDEDELELATPLYIMPDDTSVVQIGAIPYRLLTGEWNRPKIETDNTHYFALFFQPTENALEGMVRIWQDGRLVRSTAAEAAYGAVSSDENSEGYRKIDFSSELGVSCINMDGSRERDIPDSYTVQAEITGFSGQEKPVITELVMAGATASSEATV